MKTGLVHATDAGRRGMTLAEMMIGMLLGMVIIAAMLAAYIQYQRTIASTRFMREVQQNSRFAMAAMDREIAMTGYGLPIADSQLSTWIPWVSGFTANPSIVQGASGAPDGITVAAAYDRVSSLASATAAGATTITVPSGQGSLFSPSNRRVVFIGRCELARITGVSGDTLTVSRSPTSSVGLRRAHAADAPVEIVRVVSFALGTSTNVPVPRRLERTDNGVGGTNWYDRTVAGGIEDLQFSQSGAVLTVVLRARSEYPDRWYTHPVFNDQFHRETVTNSIPLRNQ